MKTAGSARKTTRFHGVSTTIASTTTSTIPPVVDYYTLGFTWFTVEVIAVVLLILLHVSMVLFVVVQGRREKAFRQAFYIFFVVVTIVDCYRMTMKLVNDMQNSVFTVSAELWEAYYTVTLFEKVSANYALVFLHVAIAVNRFTATCYPLRHAGIWSARTTTTLLLCLVFCSTLLHVVPYYILPLIISESDVVPNLPQLMGHRIDLALHICICITCAIVGFVITVTTIARLITLRRAGKLQGASIVQDVKLFAYSSFMVLIQSLIAWHSIFDLINTVIFVRRMTIWAIEDYEKSFLYWHGFDAQQWYIDFIAIETFLNTYLPLGRLNQVFCLSGTAFLLVISGHVRTSYARFYLTRFQRKPVLTTATISSGRRT